jgi:hypothetical protein
VFGTEFQLRQAEGGTVTVGEILADPEKWYGARFADPLEPDYRDDARIAYACLQAVEHGEPFIFSHAHGGLRYALVRESASIRIVAGEQPRAVDEALAVLRRLDHVYERGGELVRLVHGAISPANDEWLQDYLGRRIYFSALRHRGNLLVEERVDTPAWLAKRINSKDGERGLRELRAVITAPTVRTDGSLLVTPGYDHATGLLLMPGDWPHIPEDPNRSTLEAAVETLWQPFKDFPFVDATARGVMLAALLTAMTRPSVRMAPGISFDAPAAGSGKTLLAQCVSIIGGTAPSVVPECRSEDEMRKRLLAALRAGQGAILFDNIRGHFGSSAIEALLTSESYCDRVLGVSQLLSLPTRVLVLFSGNYFRPSGDLWRRILTARIDAKTEAPERRSFTLDPLAYCRQHRLAMVAAGLTLLRGFVAAGSPCFTPDKLASFDEWDNSVRQPVIWIGEQGLMPENASVADPARSIEEAKVGEPERQNLVAFLAAVHAIKGGERWRVADLIKEAVSSALAPADDGGAPTPTAALKDVLGEIAGDRGTFNARRLGRWIESQADRRCGGSRLERTRGRAGVAYWRVRSE